MTVFFFFFCFFVFFFVFFFFFVFCFIYVSFPLHEMSCPVYNLLARSAKSMKHYKLKKKHISQARMATLPYVMSYLPIMEIHVQNLTR